MWRWGRNVIYWKSPRITSNWHVVNRHPSACKHQRQQSAQTSSGIDIPLCPRGGEKILTRCQTLDLNMNMTCRGLFSLFIVIIIVIIIGLFFLLQKIANDVGVILKVILSFFSTWIKFNNEFQNVLLFRQNRSNLKLFSFSVMSYSSSWMPLCALIIRNTTDLALCLQEESGFVVPLMDTSKGLL